VSGCQAQNFLECLFRRSHSPNLPYCSLHTTCRLSPVLLDEKTS
jgi:hypothetical protein